MSTTGSRWNRPRSTRRSYSARFQRRRVNGGCVMPPTLADPSAVVNVDPRIRTRSILGADCRVVPPSENEDACAVSRLSEMLRASMARARFWRGPSRPPPEPPSGDAPAEPAHPPGSDLELVADRQAPDALACRREDRVAQRRRDRRHARFAHATEWRVEVSGNQVDSDLAGCLRHPRDLVRVIVVLHHAPGLVADLFLGGEAHAHDAGALELGADALGVDLRAAIDGYVHSWDRQLPLLVDRRFHHRRHVGHEAVGDGDALPAALG